MWKINRTMRRRRVDSKSKKSREKETAIKVSFLRIVTPVVVAFLAVVLVYRATYSTSKNSRWWNGFDGNSIDPASNESLGWICNAPYVNHFLLSGTFNWSAAPVHRPPLAEVSTVDVEQVSGITLFWEAYIKGRPAVVTGFRNLEELATVATGRKKNEALLNALSRAHGLMECPLTIGKIIHKNETQKQLGPHGKVNVNACSMTVIANSYILVVKHLLI